MIIKKENKMKLTRGMQKREKAEPKTPKNPKTKSAAPKAEISYESLDMSDDDISSEESERIIYFTGEVSEMNISSAISQLFSLAKINTVKPIYLVLETYGGYVDSMFSLYDAMKYIPCPVHTIAMGKVMSAGVLLLAAGHKGERLIAPHARVMTHQTYTTISGNVFELEQELTEHKRLANQWVDAMTRETGQQRDVISELDNRRGDQYLTPEQCIALGIADRLLYDITTKK